MTTLSHEETFEQFWRAYPRRVAKGDARNVWLKLRPNTDLVQQILIALAWQKDTDDWRKERGQFVPYPATWLRAERWEDEPPEVAFRRVDWQDECQRLHGGRCGHSPAMHAATMQAEREKVSS